MGHYKAINKCDPRANYEDDDFYRFSNFARFGILCFGFECWEFEGDGVELDPVSDLGIPADTKKMGWTKTW